LPGRKGDALLTVLVEEAGVTGPVSKRVPILLRRLEFSLFPEGGELATEAFVRETGRSGAVFRRFPAHVHDLLHDVGALEPRDFLFGQVERWLAPA
jgi:hypothetical protein